MSTSDQNVLRKAAGIVDVAIKDILALTDPVDSDAADTALNGACDTLRDARNYLRAEADDIPSDDEKAGHSYLAEIEAQRHAYRERAL